MNAPQLDRIVQDPKILRGKATIKGTRISVALLLNKMAGEKQLTAFLASYPHLHSEDIQAALAYAHHAFNFELALIDAHSC